MSVHSSTVKKFETAAQRNIKLVFAMEGPISEFKNEILEIEPFM